MRKSFLIVILYCAWAMAHAQYSYFDSLCIPEPEWGSSVSNNLIRESDDGYLIAGNAWNGQDWRPHICSLNTDGSIQNTFFPSSPDMTISGWYGKEFIPTTDDGYLWSGISYFGNDIESNIVIKYNENFDTTWTYHENITDSTVMFYHPVEISDGYIICGIQGTPQDDLGGYTPNLLTIHKISLEGDLVWVKKHEVYDEAVDGDALQFMRFSGIYEMDTGEIIISGGRYSYGNSQCFIVKTDSNGDNMEMFQFGHPTFGDSLPWLVPVDNHQFMVGYSYTFELGFDNPDYPLGYPHLMLFNADSMQAVWDVEVNTTWYHRNWVGGMVRTPDGNFAKTGHYENLNVATAYIELWTPTGELLWRKHYIHQTPDPGQFDRTECYEINVTQDGGFLLCGSFYDGIQRGWVLKLDACGDVEDLGCPTAVAEFQISEFRFQIAPNPASGVVNISSTNAFEHILVRDITGKIVLTTSQLNALQTQVDVSMLAKGLYLIEADFGEGRVSALRLVVE